MTQRLARVSALETDEAPSMTDLVLAFSTLRIQNARAVGSLSAAHGISPTDLRAVSFVSVNGGITPKLLAEHLGLTTGALTTLIDRLEKVALVARTAHPTDRRSILLRVTPQGAAVMAEVNELYVRAFGRAFDDSEVQRMRQSFLDLAAALGEIADSRGSHAGAAAE
jgi:DNA-binding MarR family transcriptional regulator